MSSREKVVDLAAEATELTCMNKSKEAEIQKLMAPVCDLPHRADELLQKVVEIPRLNRKMQTNGDNLLAAERDLKDNENTVAEVRGLQEKERRITEKNLTAQVALTD